MFRFLFRYSFPFPVCVLSCFFIFCLARFQWLSIWPCLDTGRSSSFDFLCVAPGHFFTTISFFEQPGDRHCMNIIECVVFSVRLSSDTPFLFERSHSSGNYVRMTRAPSGEFNSPRKVLLFYMCIHLSRCCFGCIGRVLQQ
jgi:hypothetical protein